MSDRNDTTFPDDGGAAAGDALSRRTMLAGAASFTGAVAYAGMSPVSAQTTAADTKRSASIPGNTGAPAGPGNAILERLFADAGPGATVQISTNTILAAKPSYAGRELWRPLGTSIGWHTALSGNYSHVLPIFPNGNIVFGRLGGHAAWAGNDIWGMRGREIVVLYDGAATQPTAVTEPRRTIDYRGFPTVFHHYEATTVLKIDGKWAYWSYGAAPVGWLNASDRNWPDILDQDGRVISIDVTLPRIGRVLPMIVKVNDTLAYYMGGGGPFRCWKLDFSDRSRPETWYSQVQNVNPRKPYVFNNSRTQGVYSEALGKMIITNGPGTLWMTVDLDGRPGWLKPGTAEPAKLFGWSPPRRQGKLLADIGKSGRIFWDCADDGLWEIDLKAMAVAELPAPKFKRRGSSPGFNQMSALHWVGKKLCLISVSHDRVDQRFVHNPIMGYVISA